jgi:PPOX class probable F420-dependent enzyme
VPVLDLTNPRDAHADERLRADWIVWLCTVRPDGRPHAVPVWFLWDGQTFLIFSQPEKQKLRNLRPNPHVTLALDDTKRGNDDDVVVAEGTAELLASADNPALALQRAAYLRKYADPIREFGVTPEAFLASYSQPIRITPARIRTGP